MSRRKPKENPKNALLGDLESIRTLLEDDDDDGPRNTSAEPDDLEVPVLEDIVATDSGMESPPTGEMDSGMESPPTGEMDSGMESPATGQPGLDDDLFRALLSDEWRDSASTILSEAREVIDAHAADWTEQETDTLNDALKTRIDQTMQGWMRGMVVTHMADLHEIMRKALSEELRTTIANIIEQRNETPDGQ